LDPSKVQFRVLPAVVELGVTDTVPEKVPPAGEKVGVAARDSMVQVHWPH
jgi:hypothetical protein